MSIKGKFYFSKLSFSVRKRPWHFILRLNQKLKEHYSESDVSGEVKFFLPII